MMDCPICGCQVSEGEIPCCGPRVPLYRPETQIAMLREDTRADLVRLGDELTKHRQRIADLEGALDDAMAEIRQLRAWRERAWTALREAGIETREIMRRLDLEPESQGEAGGKAGGKPVG